MVKIVLGGGLSGLSAAYYLLKRSPKNKIVLIESTNRLGGWIKSNNVENGVIFEQGPRTIRPRGQPGANTLGLIEELGLADKVIPVSSTAPAATNRMIYANGNLVSLPSSLKDLFVTTKPFSKPLIRHLIGDITASKTDLKDDTIYNFINRRFGTEVADYLISPLICGICAGNAKEISVNFLMKHLFDYEQRYGSITNGMISNLFKPKDPLKHNKLSMKALKERWSVYSLENGLETLPKALVQYLNRKNVDLQTSVKCQEIVFNKNSVNLKFDDGDLETTHLISSLPSNQLSNLLQKQHPQLAQLLNNIKYVTVGVVNLQFDKKLIPKDGFGFLIPPKEKLPILGVIYDSCCFPQKDNNTVLTVMMGGHWFQEYFGDGTNEEQLLMTACKQLKQIMQIEDKPVQSKVNILKNCIPQYILGHNENLKNIENYIKEKKLPLSLCGAAYHGVGVNDVILSAKNAVNNC